MKRVLWLDDIRNPYMDIWHTFIEAYFEENTRLDIHWVKSFEEFYRWIDENGLPDFIYFDHDLGDINNIDPTLEKTGYHCAFYVVDYCEERGIDIPPYGIQSSNPVGREKIDSLLKSYHRYYLAEH